MNENCPEPVQQWLWFPPEFVRTRGLELALARLRTDELNVALVTRTQLGEVAKLLAASDDIKALLE